MLSENTLSPINLVAAKIQSKVAKFLMQKEIILNLMNSYDTSIQQKAKELYSVQELLETKLNNELNRIDVIKQGSWSFSDIASLGIFYNTMENHLDDVHDLQVQAGNTVADPKDALPLMKWVGVAGIFFITMAALKGR